GGAIPRSEAAACVGVRSVSGKVGALAQATGRVASAARFTRRSETCPAVTRRPAVHRRAARRVRAADPGRGGRACGRRRPGRLPSRLRRLRLPGCRSSRARRACGPVVLPRRGLRRLELCLEGRPACVLRCTALVVAWYGPVSFLV